MSARIIPTATALMLMLLSSVLHASLSGLSVKAVTDKSEVYVHAQLILTIEIKSQLHLQNGSLGKPEIPDALLENLIEDEQKEIVEDGLRTVVFTRSYAVFPSKAGVLTIPSIAFEGSVVDSSGGGLGGFFGRGRRVRAGTEPITLNIKPIPSSFPKNQPFLPVKSLTVVESFDDEKHELGVNKALTRRFEIKALGSLAAFLPILKTPILKKCEVYSETGTKAQEKSPEGLIASVNFSQVYLPLEAGLVSIPEQVIYWWDTDLDQLKTTPIRPFEFNVLGDANKAVPASPAPDTNAEIKEGTGIGADSNANNQSDVVVKTRASWSSVLWPLLAVLFFVLWIATLAYLFFIKRKAHEPEKISEISKNDEKLSTLVADVQKACDKGSMPDALFSLRELLKWSLEHEEAKSIVAKLATSIYTLEGALYGQKDIPAADVLLEVKKYMGEIKNRSPEKKALPALYPL